MKKILILLLLTWPLLTNATTYYVDASSTGSNAGTLANPWKTLSAINQSLLQPGDFVLFKRGSTFSGSITISRSGTAGNPITFGAYGTGNKPKFTGTGSTINTLFYVNNRSYLIFRDWEITDPTIDNADRTIDAKIQRVFTFDGSTNNCKIISCDIELAGVGAYWVGGSNTMDSCDVGNLRMVVDTDQGFQPGNDDDYGANPLVISSANNTITHNYFHDCWANSFDYTYDGGAIEFFGANTNNNFIGYNTMVDCIGLSEITGNSSNNTFVYNKLINMGSIFYFQSGSTYANWGFYNNAVIESVAPRVPEKRIIGGSITTGAVILKNNVFQVANGTNVGSSSAGIVHSYNAFKLSGGSQAGFVLSTGEFSTSGTIFTSTTGDPVTWNYTPIAGSALINTGTPVGQSVDFSGKAIVNSPDIGVLEFDSVVVTPPPTPVRTFIIKGGAPFILKPGN